MAAGDLVAHLRSGPTRYWPEPRTESAYFQARFPDRARLLAMADLAACDRIQFWQPWHMEQTHRPVRVGRWFDWQRSPNGDREWSHALARSTHLVDLAAAYAITGDGRYIDAFERWLRRWQRARRRPGPLWTNPLTTALRVVNVVAAIDLVRGSPRLTEAACRVVARELPRDVAFVGERISTSVGNWEFAIVAAGLIGGHVLAPVLDTRDVVARAGRRLEEILATELLPGGTLIEQVPMYHGEALLHLMQLIKFAETADLSLPFAARDAAGRMFRRLHETVDLEDRIPPLGDSDRFSLRYVRGVAETVLGVDFDPAWRQVPGTPTCGQPAGSWLDRPAPYALTLADAGSVVARTREASGRGAWVYFDGTSRPPERRRWHSHADELQVLVHTEAGPLLTDPGRFTYTPVFAGAWPLMRRPMDPRGRLRPLFRWLYPERDRQNDRDWRAYFAGAAAHNVLAPVGYARSATPVFRQAPPEVTPVAQHECGPLLLLTGEARWAQGEHWPAFAWSRTVVAIGARCWLILDRAQAAAATPWVAGWHLGSQVTPAGQGMQFDLDLGGVRHRVTFTSPPDDAWLVAVEPDWSSPRYNLRQPAATVRAAHADATSVTLLTRLDLDSAESGRPEAAEALTADGSVQLAWREGEDIWRLRLGPRRLLGSWYGLVTDARLAVVCTGAGGALRRVLLLDGTRVDAGDGRLIDVGAAGVADLRF